MPRYTMDVGHDFEALLTLLAKQKGVPKSEIIRRAVACYKFLTDEERKHGGHKVSITTIDDVVIKDVVLP